MKFIVVDDEEINLFLTTRLLSKVLKVDDVQTFQEAGEALRFLQNCNSCETVSLFLDLNMPVISGWDFLEFFDQFDDSLKSRVHIYILSSSVDPMDKARAFANANVISFISKPLTAAFLSENFLGQYKDSK